MVFSRAAQYAIRALTYLAMNYPNGLCPLEKIAKDEDIPQPFLGKILQGLAHKRLIRSSKGLKGGFGLALPLEQITLYSIVDAIDNLSVTQADCVLGRSQCNEENPCAMHHFWKTQNANHLEFLNTVTLQHLYEKRDTVPASTLRTKRSTHRSPQQLEEK